MNIINNYNVFLFDMYGVLWSGKDFYENVKETLKLLKDNNKIVYILSNSSALSDSLKKRVTEEYRDGVITSGDIVANMLKEGKIEFNDKKERKNVYIFGKKPIDLFNDTKYKVVENIEEAEFVYISIPQFTEDEYNNYTGDKNIFKKSKNGNWDSVEITPFLPSLEKFLSMNLPLLNANPDLVAQEIDVNSNEVNYVTRQGEIAETYRKMGGEVLEFGKPNVVTYNYTFDDIEKSLGIKIDKTKTVMIGDTLRTDIKGGNNAGIDSILFSKTGVTAEELRNGADLEELYKKYNAKPTIVLEDINDMFENLKK